MQSNTYSLVDKTTNLEDLIKIAKAFVASAKAPATLKAYRNDWRDFESWCRAHQLPFLGALNSSLVMPVDFHDLPYLENSPA
jgi:hypothetical protein